MAFRSTPATESSGYSPYHLVFGKEMTLPVDVGLLPKTTMPNQTKQYLDDLMSKFKISTDIARQNMELAKQKTKERFDKKARVPDFQVNDKVLLRCHAVKPGLSPKLSHKWDGPFVIVSVGSKFTYKIKNCQTNKLMRSYVNAQRLKHYQESLHTDLSDQNIPNANLSQNDPQPDFNADPKAVLEEHSHGSAPNMSDVNPQPVVTKGPQSSLATKTVETKCPQVEPQSVEHQDAKPEFNPRSSG